MSRLPSHGLADGTLDGQLVHATGDAVELAARPTGHAAAPWRRRAMLAVGLVLLALAVLALIVGREAPAPAWVAARIEHAAAEALGDGALRVRSVGMRIRADLRPELRVRGAELVGGDGRLLARVPEIAVTLAPLAALADRALRVREVAVTGAALSLARASDGRLNIALGTGSATSLGSVPDLVDRLLDHPDLAALREVRVDALMADYVDARAGRAWTLEAASLRLDLRDGAMRLSGEARVRSERAAIAYARLGYDGRRGSRAAQITLELRDVAAADAASQSAALAWLGVLDAPVSARLGATIDAAGGLGPLGATISMGAGRLSPGAGARPVPFGGAGVRLSYDPVAGAIRFEAVELRSGWGAAQGSGTAYLREIRDGRPGAIEGQFRLTDVMVAPGLGSLPVRLPDATAGLRLRLDPFALDIVGASLGGIGEDGRLSLGGRVAAGPDGWRVALDAQVPAIGRDRLLALWPEEAWPAPRAWLVRNLSAGTLRDATGALRLAPGAPPVMALSASFDGVEIRPLATHPPIQAASGRLTMEGRSLAVALDAGRVEAPLGGRIDLRGTTFAVPAGGGPRVPARIDLAARGTITAALSLLDMPPHRFLAGAGLPADLARGTVDAAGVVELSLAGPSGSGDFRYDVAARLEDVASSTLVPGHEVTAPTLVASATPERIEVGGALRVGPAAVEGVWRQPLGPEARDGSEVEAVVELSPHVLEAFGVALPPGHVEGRGKGTLVLGLGSGEAPRFALRSDLRGLALAVPGLGWSKPADAPGELLVEGRLGTPAAVDRLALSAPGLSAEGALSLTPDGALDRLELARVQVAGWLDAPVTLVSLGEGLAPALLVEGGTLDLRAATFGGGEGGGPVSLALDRLQVTDGIALTDVAGEFSTEAGLEGSFVGRVNGGPPVTGRVAPQAGRVGARLQADDAGAVMRAAGLFGRAEGGGLDLLLLPVGAAGYEGEAWITGLRVRDAPVLASLLNAVSVVGLLQQLGGLGILFDEVSADFRIEPGRITVARSSAAGAGLGLSLDGAYDTTAGRMDFRGVVSPVYLVNQVGAVLTQPGEGLLGFNYTLRGDPAAPEVGVNPLSGLAPGFLRGFLRPRQPAG